MVDLLCFNIDNVFTNDKFETALSWLPQEEHGSVLRFKFKRDQHLALGSLLLRRYYFSKELNVDWNQLEFGRHYHGKPYLKNTDLYDYNTSHEGTWVIFACTKQGKVGVDVVCIEQPSGISMDDFISSFQAQLTITEYQNVMQQQDQIGRLTEFYKYWALKESYIKAIGVGLNLDLTKLNFSKDSQDEIKMDFEGKRMDEWNFHTNYLDERSFVVVCTQVKVPPVAHQVTLDSMFEQPRTKSRV